MSLYSLMILGELEKLVLKFLWQAQSADVKEVHRHFEKSRGGSLNTIQSTLDRLYKKGLLAREKKSHSYVYTTAVDRQEFIGQLIRSVTHDFSEDGDALLTAFVNFSADRDEGSLDRLESLIREYRNQRKKDRK